MPVNPCCCTAGTRCNCFGYWIATWLCNGDDTNSNPHWKIIINPAFPYFGLTLCANPAVVADSPDFHPHDWTQDGNDPCKFTKIAMGTVCISCGTNDHPGNNCIIPDPGHPIAPGPDCCPCNGFCWLRWTSTYDCDELSWGDIVADPGAPFFGGGANQLFGTCMSDAVATANGITEHAWALSPDDSCVAITTVKKATSCACGRNCMMDDPGLPTFLPTGCCAPCDCPCGSWPGVTVDDGGTGVYPCGSGAASLVGIYVIQFNYQKFHYVGSTDCTGGTVDQSCTGAMLVASVHATDASCTWSTLPFGDIDWDGETCTPGFSLDNIDYLILSLDTTPGQCGWIISGVIAGGVVGIHLKKTPAGGGPGGSVDPRGSYSSELFCRPGPFGDSTQWTFTGATVS